MTLRHCFEDGDITFRDILSFSYREKSHLPFGGKIVVLVEDFTQMLLVIPKETRQDIVHANINASYLWSL